MPRSPQLEQRYVRTREAIYDPALQRRIQAGAFGLILRAHEDGKHVLVRIAGCPAPRYFTRQQVALVKQ